jgi:hypothetical protein
MAGIAVADTGVRAVLGAVQADAIMRIAALDPLDVAGDLTQHRAAPRDLGTDHSTISWNRVSAVEGAQTRSFDSTSPDAFINVDEVDRVENVTLLTLDE